MSIKCDICAKEFENHRQLNGHKSIHNSNGRYKKSRRKFHPSNCIHCKKQTSRHMNKYCSIKCQTEWRHYNVHVPEIILGKTGKNGLNRFLVERDGRKCSCCGLVEWNNFPIPLDIDHIDGNPTNHLPENLRFLCPNCHRLTETWGMKKTKIMKTPGRRKNSRQSV